MYNNPIFQYGGINNAGGAAPYNISLVNTGTTEERVNLFNAQENLTAQIEARTAVQPGATYPIGFSMEQIHIFDPRSGQVL